MTRVALKNPNVAMGMIWELPVAKKAANVVNDVTKRALDARSYVKRMRLISVSSSVRRTFTGAWFQASTKMNTASQPMPRMMNTLRE